MAGTLLPRVVEELATPMLWPAHAAVAGQLSCCLLQCCLLQCCCLLLEPAASGALSTRLEGPPLISCRNQEGILQGEQQKVDDWCMFDCKQMLDVSHTHI